MTSKRSFALSDAANETSETPKEPKQNSRLGTASNKITWGWEDEGAASVSLWSTNPRLLFCLGALDLFVRFEWKISSSLVHYLRNTGTKN